MYVDLDLPFLGLDGEPAFEVLVHPDGKNERRNLPTMAKFLARELFSTLHSESVEPPKAYDWSLIFHKTGGVEMVLADLDALIEMVQANKTYTNWLSTQLLRQLEKHRQPKAEVSEEKASAHTDAPSD
jgi:hypothetical protein